MTAYILGAGASLHAGYPLAGQLGGALYDWISNKKPEYDLYRTRIEIIRDAYGNLPVLPAVHKRGRGRIRSGPNQSRPMVGCSEVIDSGRVRRTLTSCTSRVPHCRVFGAFVPSGVSYFQQLTSHQEGLVRFPPAPPIFH